MGRASNVKKWTRDVKKEYFDDLEIPSGCIRSAGPLLFALASTTLTMSFRPHLARDGRHASPHHLATYHSVAWPISMDEEHTGPSDKEEKMNGTRMIAMILIIAGALGLLYGGFSYMKDSKAVKLGSIELSVKERQTINIPTWAGVGAIVVGGLLLVLGGKKS
jgi:hypothetical protein